MHLRLGLDKMSLCRGLQVQQGFEARHPRQTLLRRGGGLGVLLLAHMYMGCLGCMGCMGCMGCIDCAGWIG